MPVQIADHCFHLRGGVKSFVFELLGRDTYVPTFLSRVDACKNRLTGKIEFLTMFIQVAPFG